MLNAEYRMPRMSGDQSVHQSRWTPQCAFKHILLYHLQVMFPYDWLSIHFLSLDHVPVWRDGACAMRLIDEDICLSVSSDHLLDMKPTN